MDQMKAAFVVAKADVSFVKKCFCQGSRLLGVVGGKGLRGDGIRAGLAAPVAMRLRTSLDRADAGAAIKRRVEYGSLIGVRCLPNLGSRGLQGAARADVPRWVPSAGQAPTLSMHDPQDKARTTHVRVILRELRSCRTPTVGSKLPTSEENQ